MNKSLNSDDGLTLRRLRFRSSHRGCKETDLVLGSFAEHALDGLGPAELAAYAALLEESDADIWDWLVGRSAPSRPEYAPLVERLRQYQP